LNVVKIYLDNFKRITASLKKIEARHKGEFYQIDTYYNCRNSRLKIREINNKNFELIFYQRANSKNSKSCNYQILDIKKDQIKIIKSILKNTLGEKVVIKKERDLWIYKHTRIHLDKIDKLGKFLELETVIKKINHRGGKIEHDELINLLGLSSYKKYGKSYSDLLCSGF